MDTKQQAGLLLIASNTICSAFDSYNDEPRARSTLLFQYKPVPNIFQLMFRSSFLAIVWRSLAVRSALSVCCSLVVARWVTLRSLLFRGLWEMDARYYRVVVPVHLAYHELGR
jgi:hypothetical protein